MIEIDGSQGEGGGQILRSSLTLSLLTGKPFRLRRIRANRAPRPGLRPQHLASVRAAARIGQATVSGDAVGSSQLTFTPGTLQAGEYRFAIGTAGATGLVLQTIALPLARAGAASTVEVEGGTHVDKAPCFHFLQTTWQAYLRKVGVPLRTEMLRPGFYPRGGGKILSRIEPAGPFRPIRMDRKAEIRAATLLVATSHLPDHVAQRCERRARVRLEDARLEVEARREEWPGDPGCVVLVTLEGAIPTLFAGLGERGKPAEAVADDAVDAALAYRDSGMPVDEHSVDQILLPLACAEGDSELHVSQISRHLTTNADVLRQFLDCVVQIEGEEGSPGIVKVHGMPL